MLRHCRAAINRLEDASDDRISSNPRGRIDGGDVAGPSRRGPRFAPSGADAGLVQPAAASSVGNSATETRSDRIGDVFSVVSSWLASGISY